MSDLMDIFTRPLPEHERLPDPPAPGMDGDVPRDHPLAAEMREVALAHTLVMQGQGVGSREAMRRVADGLRMPQERVDMLLAEHRRVTGVVPGSRPVEFQVIVLPGGSLPSS